MVLTLQFFYVQYNLNGSNTDTTFTLDNSNSFSSPRETSDSSRKRIFRDILREFSYLIMKMYVVCTCTHLIEAILMSTFNIRGCVEDRKAFLKLSPFAS